MPCRVSLTRTADRSAPSITPLTRSPSSRTAEYWKFGIALPSELERYAAHLGDGRYARLALAQPVGDHRRHAAPLRRGGNRCGACAGLDEFLDLLIDGEQLEYSRTAVISCVIAALTADSFPEPHGLSLLARRFGQGGGDRVGEARIGLAA